jgi:PD-(D/E)XK nuclease superfamily protein
MPSGDKSKTLQATMSRSEILIECSYPFGRLVPTDERSEAANYGSAFHEGLDLNLNGKKVRSVDIARLVRKWSLPERVGDELMETIPQGEKVFRRWLSDNEFGIDFSRKLLATEQALALTPLVRARVIGPPDKDHIYQDAKRSELPGTPDYVGRGKTYEGAVILVEDHKTGNEDFSKVLDKPQLLSLGIAAARAYTKDPTKTEIVLAVLHAWRRGMAKVYAERVKFSDLAEHERKLKVGLDDIGTGRLRPGPQCDRCPGQAICPARGGQLAEQGAEVLRGLIAAGGGSVTAAIVPANRQTSVATRDQKLGRLYSLIQAAERMTKQGRDEIRQEVIAGAMPETKDGYLVIRTHIRESLSKNSIYEAYGKLKAERMIAQFRKDGAIKSTEVKQLDVAKERGE